VMKVAKKRRRSVATLGKHRPRSHVIADMSESHLDQRVHACGYTIEHFRKDYGYDAFIFTFDDNRNRENGIIYVQLKATDKLRLSPNGRNVRFRISTRDIKLWQDEFMPVYLVLYDASGDVAYWVYLQQYLARKGIRAAKLNVNSITIDIDARNVLSAASIRTWRVHKRKAVAQIRVNHA
jgi:hypothetical protein